MYLYIVKPGTSYQKCSCKFYLLYYFNMAWCWLLSLAEFWNLPVLSEYIYRVH